MKKVGLLFGAVVAAVSLTTGGVSAGTGSTTTTPEYPPSDDVSLTLSASTVVVSATFTATFTGCELGETVNFVLDGTTVQGACNGAAGSRRLPTATGEAAATVTLTAPATPGTYDVVATGGTSGLTATTSVTVVAASAGGTIPQTGSDSSIPTAQIAGGLVIVGAGLAGVAGFRRRKTAAAA